MVRGIMLMGTTGMLQGRDDPTPAVVNDPVWLPAEDIERGINDGFLKAGVFKNVQVHPPVDQLPERWHFLFKE